MNKEEIIKAILPWNFWGKTQETGFLREEYVQEVIAFLKSNKVVTITGIRRAGKSVIAKQVAQKLAEGKNSLIVNFEEVRLDEEKDNRFLVKLYDAYTEFLSPETYPLIILDEVQEVTGWEKFVRSLNEKKEARIIVTGSNAKIMSEELATLLTGRTLILEVFPLTFKEFLKFKGLDTADKLQVIKKESLIKNYFREYTLYGGFPEVVLEKGEELKLKILNSYSNDILYKDIIRRFKIKRIDKLERVASFFLTNFSSPITFNSLGKFLKLDEKIVEKYSKNIESSKLIFFLKRFSSSIKEQENSPRKVYLRDIGFHNLSNILFSDKVSKLYENIVAIHLLRTAGEKVFYWKDAAGREVDFLIKEKSTVSRLIQVSYSLKRIETREREINSLSKAMEEFGLAEGLVITSEYENTERINGKEIRFIPLWKWLLTD